MHGRKVRVAGQRTPIKLPHHCCDEPERSLPSRQADQRRKRPMAHCMTPRPPFAISGRMPTSVLHGVESPPSLGGHRDSLYVRSGFGTDGFLSHSCGL